MALEKITKVTGRGVHVPGDDIDTDRIIPARFMKCVTFDGLGEYLFHDVRFDADGIAASRTRSTTRASPARPSCSSDRNFGCGSSREHAPQAIAKSRLHARSSPRASPRSSSATATTLGIPCACVSRRGCRRAGRLVEREPALEVVVDLEAQEVTRRLAALPLWMKPGAREALVTGQWDPIGQLLDGAAETARVAEALPYLRF